MEFNEVVYRSAIETAVAQEYLATAAQSDGRLEDAKLYSFVAQSWREFALNLKKERLT